MTSNLKPTTNKKRLAIFRAAVARRDGDAVMAALGELSASELAETLKQHNEQILRWFSAEEEWTPEAQAELREKIGDLSACWLGDGADGLNVTRDPFLLQLLAKAYRAQLLMDTEAEPIN
jgi:hypothetical protein